MFLALLLICQCLELTELETILFGFVLYLRKVHYRHHTSSPSQLLKHECLCSNITTFEPTVTKSVLSSFIWVPKPDIFFSELSNLFSKLFYIELISAYIVFISVVNHSGASFFLASITPDFMTSVPI
ncbi:unnamed protein product [Debaryomyces tyrocola]|nr:unnamed protein product [Debaryomyces tyrocola]